MKHMSHTMTLTLFWTAIAGWIFIMYASYHMVRIAKIAAKDVCTEKHGTKTIAHSISGDTPLSRYKNKYPFVTSICAKKRYED